MLSCSAISQLVDQILLFKTWNNRGIMQPRWQNQCIICHYLHQQTLSPLAHMYSKPAVQQHSADVHRGFQQHQSVTFIMTIINVSILLVFPQQQIKCRCKTLARSDLLIVLEQIYNLKTLHKLKIYY